jgi:SSS family solute:Na+ symporter
MGILWRRTNYAGALFGLIGGTVIQILVVLVAHWLGLNLHWLYLACLAQVVTMIGIAVVSLATPPMDPDKTRPMMWSLSALTEYEEDRPRPWYQRLWLWFGIFAVVWVCLYWRFW